MKHSQEFLEIRRAYGHTIESGVNKTPASLKRTPKTKEYKKVTKGIIIQ